MTPRQACNVVFFLAMDGRDEKESKQFLNELNAPLDPKQRRAEQRALKGG